MCSGDATACLPGFPVLIESPGEVKGRKGDRQVDQMNRLHRLEAQRGELAVKGPWATVGVFSITLTDEFGAFSLTLTDEFGVCSTTLTPSYGNGVLRRDVSCCN